MTSSSAEDDVRDPADAVFATHRLVVAYDGDRVIDDVSLSISPGEFVAVLGANGSGKTTLMRALLGLIPPAGGRVLIEGEPPPRYRHWRRVGYVPQRLVSAGAVPVSVQELVHSVWAGPRHRLRRLTAEDRERGRDALRRMGLWERRHDRFDTLSGGQQRRALIARALSTGPVALVLDEPTAGVDAESQSILADELRRLHADGTAVVLVTHELGEVAALATRVVFLARNGRGSVRYDGPPPIPDGLSDPVWHHSDDRPVARPEPLLEDR